jgi:putative peptidoglycan lipid II flippase
MKKEQILKKSISLMLLTLFSRILGLAREIVRAAYLGTSGLSDAFALGFQIPNLLRRLFAEGSIAVAFVPVFKGLALKNNKQEIKDFLSSFFTVLTFIVTTTIVIATIFTTPIVSLFFGNLKQETFKETVFLTKIMFPYLGFISIAAFFQGILNTKNIFSPSGFTPILFNISVIASTIISPSV